MCAVHGDVFPIVIDGVVVVPKPVSAPSGYLPPYLTNEMAKAALSDWNWRVSRVRTKSGIVTWASEHPDGVSLTNEFPIRYFLERTVFTNGADRRLEWERNGFYYDKVLPETQPASEDPEGNWGRPAGIFQLSLRFRRARYTFGETVPAVLILRNLSYSNTPSWVRNMGPDMGYVLLLNHGGTNSIWFRPQSPLPKRRPSNDDYRHTDPESYSMIAHVGELTVMELNDYFDLSATGIYTLKAQLRVPTDDGRAMTNLFSGIAKFEIVQKK